jgi:cell division protein FtsL
VSPSFTYTKEQQARWETENMEQHLKQFFDLLDYATIRAFLYVLMVIGAFTLIRLVHAKNAHSSQRKIAARSKKKASQV